jgi:hypothetical protein
MAPEAPQGAARRVSDDYRALPRDLPVPVDDGAADHLPGTTLPPVILHSTAGGEVALDQLPPGRTLIYVYPMTGRPGVALPEGWDQIPGARGCTPESWRRRRTGAPRASRG